MRRLTTGYSVGPATFDDAGRLTSIGRLKVGPVGGTYDADYPEGLSERGVSRGGANVDIEILLGAAAIL